MNVVLATNLTIGREAVTVPCLKELFNCSINSKIDSKIPSHSKILAIFVLSRG